MTFSRAYALEHFDELCERAENGEDVVLQRPGKPGLALVPRPAEKSCRSVEDAVEAIRRHMHSRPPAEGQIDYKALIDEGRRF